MSKREKLLKRLLSRPTDFTFEELVTLLVHLEFKSFQCGNTSGSACSFKKKRWNKNNASQTTSVKCIEKLPNQKYS